MNLDAARRQTRLSTAHVAFVALAIAWPCAKPAYAAEFVWTGDGSDDNWTTDENWFGGQAPGARFRLDADVVMRGPNGLMPFVDDSFSFGSLSFAETAPSFTMTPLSPSISISLSGTLWNEGVNLQRIDARVFYLGADDSPPRVWGGDPEAGLLSLRRVDVLAAGLDLQGVAIDDLVVHPGAAVRLLADEQLSRLVSVSPNASLRLNGFDTTAEGLLLANGGLVDTGTGTLTLDRIVGSRRAVSDPPGLVRGNLRLPSTLSRIEVIPEAQLELDAAVTVVGEIVKVGAGTLLFGGDTQLIPTEGGVIDLLAVNEGTLVLDSTVSLPPTRIVIGDGAGAPGSGEDVVRLMRPEQIHLGAGGRITVNHDGLLDLNGFDDHVGRIDLHGGRIETGGGTMPLHGTVTSFASASTSLLHGGVGLGRAVKTRFIVHDGPADEDLIIDGTVSEFDLIPELGGSGALEKRGEGTLVLRGNTPNTYQGTTYVDQGTLVLNKMSPIDRSYAIPASLVIGDGIGGAASDVVRVLGPGRQIALLEDAGDATVTVTSTGLLEVANGEAFQVPNQLILEGGSVLIGSNTSLGVSAGGLLTSRAAERTATIAGLASSARLQSQTTYSVADGAPDVDLDISATAAVPFTKTGAGTLNLSGETFGDGLVTIQDGTLLVNGHSDAGFEVQNGAVLGGEGNIVSGPDGVVVLSGGTLAPGDGIGQFDVDTLVTMNPGATLQIEMRGPIAGASYDVLDVDNINLNGASLDLRLNGGFENRIDNADTFSIVNMAGSITGEFAGLPDGARVEAVDALGSFRINYGPGSPFDPQSVVLSDFLLGPDGLTWFRGAGNWSAAENWVPEPGGEQVVPNNDGVATYVATINGGTATLDLPVEVTNLNLNNGSLRLLADLSVAGQFTMVGGNLRGAGSVSAESMTWTRGTIGHQTAGAADLELTVEGPLTVSGDHRKDLQRGAKMILRGPATWSGKGDWQLFADAQLQIENVLNIQAAEDEDVQLGGSATVLIINQGTIIQSGAAEVAIFGRLANSGTIEAQEGTIRLHNNGTSTHTGATLRALNPGTGLTFTGSARATLDADTSLHIGAGAELVFRGSNTRISVADENFHVAGTMLLTGTSTIAFVVDTQLRLEEGATLELERATLTGIGGGSLTTPRMTWGSGNIGRDANEAVSVTVQDTLTLAGDLHRNLHGGSRLTLNGRAVWTDGGDLLVRSRSAGGNVFDAVLEINDVFSIQTTGDVDLGAHATAQIINRGTITKLQPPPAMEGEQSPPAGTTKIRGQLDNTGIIEALTGTIELQSNGTHTHTGATLRALNDDTGLTFTGSARATLDAETSLHIGAGAELEFRGNNTRIGVAEENFHVAGTMRLTGANTIAFVVDTHLRLQEGATLELNRATLTGTDDGGLTTPSMTWGSGNIGRDANEAVSVTVEDTLTLAGDLHRNLHGGSRLTLNGRAVWTDSGDLLVRSRSSDGNVFDAVLEINDVFSIQTTGDVDLRGHATAQIINRGTITKLQPPPAVEGEKPPPAGTTKIRGQFDNTGTLRVQAGTIDVAGTLLQRSGTTLTGGRWEVDNATLVFAGGPASNITTNQATVILRGTDSVFAKFDALADNQGTFEIHDGRQFSTAGDLANSGSIVIGDASTLTVGGNYTISDGSVTHVNGQLDVPSGITVEGGSVISGTGTVLSDVIVNADGIISPGDSPSANAATASSPGAVPRGNNPSTITINGNLTLADGAVYDWRVEDGAPGLDRIMVNGDLVLGDPQARPVLRVIDLGGQPSGTFDIISYTGRGPDVLGDWRVEYANPDPKIRYDGQSGSWDDATNWDRRQLSGGTIDHNVAGRTMSLTGLNDADVGPQPDLEVVIDSLTAIVVSGPTINTRIEALELGGLGEATLVINEAGTIETEEGTTINSGGRLAGIGKVGGEVQANRKGRLRPGQSASLVALGSGAGGGTLIMDDLIFDDGAIYEWELSPGASNTIVVEGQLAFGSEAVLELIDAGGVPDPLQEYVLFSYAETEFDPFNPLWTIDATAVPDWDISGARIFVDEEADRVVLTGLDRLITILEADFDEDGDVDGNDLLAWQLGLGTATGAAHTQGDADADGDVDGNDFLFWQRQFGSVSAAAAPGHVPEPGALVLLLVAVAGCVTSRTAQHQCPERVL